MLQYLTLLVIHRAWKNPYHIDLGVIQNTLISVNQMVIAQNYVCSFHMNGSYLVPTYSQKPVL